jgi:hypothetical protein
MANAHSYNLYRGTSKGNWPDPLPPFSSNSVSLPDLPGPPELYFYRVAGVSCSGMEGP